MEIKEPLISIIIPIFNVEKYLDRSISSLIEQTYRNFEVILVNDGSTDNSKCICEKDVSKDSRFKLINQKNCGVAAARNTGLEYASGEYIGFIDPDDFAEKDYISFLYNNMINNKCDISICGYYHYYNEELKEIRHYENIDEVIDDCTGIIYLNTIGYFGNGLWNKLFRAEVFKDIRFPDGKLSEDWFILFKLISNARRIYYNSTPKYYYQQRIGSITRSSKINEDCVEASKECLVFCEKYYPKAIPSAIQSYILACIGVYNTFLCSNRDKEKLNEYKNKIYKYKNNVSLDNINKSRVRQIKLFYSNTSIYNGIFKIFDIYRKMKYKVK